MQQNQKSVSVCPTCNGPCEATVQPRGGEWGWGTSDKERTTYDYVQPRIVAWRVIGHCPGGWVDGSPSPELLEDIRVNSPGVKLEFAYGAPQT